MTNKNVKQMLKNVIQEDAIGFKTSTSKTLYNKLGKILQENYKKMCKNLIEAAGDNGDNQVGNVYWSGGLGGAQGQGSPANQYFDQLDNSRNYNFTTNSNYYPDIHLASSLPNIPPLGSTPNNMPKGWTQNPNQSNMWKSPGGWVWSYYGGIWYMRPPDSF